MNWIVLSYSLPSEAKTPRVTIWRRLRRLGAIAPSGGVYILPALDECIEAFQWLSQEVRQAGGDALVMHVPQFEPLNDNQLVNLFNEAREAEYSAIESQASDLAAQVSDGGAAADSSGWQGALNKLHKQHAEVAKVDFFQSPAGIALSSQLAQLGRQITPEEFTETPIVRADPAQYQNRTWVTRPRPFVDRLACAWLIRRYIDGGAVIHYAAAVEPEQVGFDMDQAQFSHVGNLCTFEVMVLAFALEDPALHLMAQIVHEIDLQDGRYQRPETIGVEAVIRGLVSTDRSDSEIEVQGLGLFDGLYAALTQPATALMV
jgi:hypothetical protein